MSCWCKDCRSEQGHRWYLANREKRQEQIRQYYQDHREEMLAHAREYYKDNPRQYTPEQRERRRESVRQWNRDNRERKRETNRQWYLANPGKRRESAARLRKRYPLYKTWESMLDRCENQKCKDYKRYGARGITVCPEWHDFRVFAADIERLIGRRPDGKSLDRINNDGNYEPGNVKWSTPKEQAANRRPRRRKPI